MNHSKPLHLTISLNDADGNPVPIETIEINGKIFSAEFSDKKESQEEKVIEDAVVVPIVTDAVEDEKSTPKEKDKIGIQEIKPVDSSDEYDTLEKFGGNAFHRMFWGTLKYEALGDNRCKVTYQGEEGVFSPEYIGMWLEPSRVHRSSFEYPERGRNYFPGALTVVYSRVLEVLDDKNLLVDFPYNGGNLESPKVMEKQDGIFFFDNRFAIESWASSISRKSTLKARAGQVYGVLGMPKIVVPPDSTWNFETLGEGPSAAIHLMWSDAFNGDKYGRGLEQPGSFSETFGENGALFHLPDMGKVDINFEWQFLPSNYSQRVVQFGSPNGLIFSDSSAFSYQYGLKRFRNTDQYRIRKAMEDALGFVRPGTSFSMPNQGYCNGGGIHDERDVKEFCTYRFEGDWYSKDLNNMKARQSGGLRIEWEGESSDQRGRFIELESLKPFRFEGIRLRMLDHQTIELDDPNFSWYHLACQEWTGGTSTSSETVHLIVDGYRVGLNSNGDHWLVHGDEDLSGVSFSARQVKTFDKIPTIGDIISQDLDDFSKNGIIGKKGPNILEIWGWSVQKGDVFTFAGQKFEIIKTNRKWKTWAQFAEQYSSPPSRLKRGDRRVTYTEIELDKPIDDPVSSIELKVEKSALAHLLNGRVIEGCQAVWNFGNDSPGHLMYTDYNVNMVMRNVEIHGMIRSTSRPLWTEISDELSGTIKSFSVGSLGSDSWKKGMSVVLFDPHSGIKEELVLSKSYSGKAERVYVEPKELSGTFPKGSILTCMYSLCSEARFENVFFVNEDLSPCYSERIDYRPQGLRLRQLLTDNDGFRVKIKGGRISWYSNLDNLFEPEVELSNHPHLVNPKSVVPVILNPIFMDKKGARFGFQQKGTKIQELYFPNRVVVRDQFEVDLSNSEIQADLWIEGNGKIILDRFKSLNFEENNQEMAYGFNLTIQERFSKIQKLVLKGKEGSSALNVASKIPIGALEIDLKDWKLQPGIFNAGGFQTQQNKNDPDYKKYIKIES
ncbi:hypothetical protein KUV23_00615 [Algoriphagus marincola]|uniref:Uncharacterized protein n=1 Tax=Algoriphagus marincola TaxID=264027 RepID=A0ABS7N0C6_9BACT|nr:hypothetical protein [Algoriphagus marincola]MBY5949450.1 hypothetical protein [Algoriphagus marincola]